MIHESILLRMRQDWIGRRIKNAGIKLGDIMMMDFIRRIFNCMFLCLFLIGSVLNLTAEELTLERALAIAFKNSPSMREAALQLEINERNLIAEQAGLKSQFNLSLTPINISSSRVFSDLTSQYNTQDQTKSEARFSITQPIKWTDGTLTLVNRLNWQEASSSFTGSIKQSNYSNSFYIQLKQPLFTYNRTTLRIKELELDLENTKLSYAIQKLQIEKQVTQQFFDLYLSRMRVQIAQEEYRNATESMEIIRSRVEAGISAPEELYQAELTQANSLASLENNKMQHENSLDNFKVLLGLEIQTLIDVTADVQKKIVKVELNKAVDHGLNNRLELRQKDIAIQNAMDNLVKAGAENEFKASIDLSFGLTGTNKMFQDIYQSPNQDRLIAITLDIPLFDWGKKKQVLAASEAQILSQKLSAEELINQIKIEIIEGPVLIDGYVVE